MCLLINVLQDTQTWLVPVNPFLPAIANLIDSLFSAAGRCNNCAINDTSIKFGRNV